MNRNFFLMSAAFSAMLLTAQQLSAQQRGNCAPHGAVVARLAERYGESRQVMALAGDNSVLEVFASDETGTWTITVTPAGAATCLIAAGQNYQHLAEALPQTIDDPA